MMRRGAIALLAMSLAPGCAPPPPPATVRSDVPPPVVRPAPPALTLDQPFAVRTTTAAFEPAPMPNRAIEAPPDRLSDPMAPRLEPMVLRPDRPQGMTFGSEHLRDSVPDRSVEEMLPQGLRVPMDNLLPGARLRIPFE